MYFEAEQKGAIFGEMVEVNGECNFFRYLHYFSGDNLSAKVKLCHIVLCFHRRARRVCSVDRAEIASNNKVCGFINNFKYVFYVPLNFGLGDFLFAMGVKEIEGFAKRYGKL